MSGSPSWIRTGIVNRRSLGSISRTPCDRLTSSMTITRRDLLKTPALLPFQVRAGAWYDRPMRWGQLTLVENDPPDLKVGYWLDYFQKCRCDAVTLSAGGVVAFYPTKVPMHYRSTYLGDRDSSGDLCRGCQ